METVSIIVPCYNGSETIDRCLNSIYQQDYAKVELIIVDDGSTDDSKEKILFWKERFLAKGFLFKYCYQENQGPSGAINTGLKLVTGAFLSLLDADDEYIPGAIAERVHYLNKNPDCDVVRSNGWIVRANSRFLFINSDEEKNIKNIFLPLLRGNTNNWSGSYMLRTKALFDFYPQRSFYPSRYGQNLQILLPLVYKKKCGFIDKAHMNYIQLGESICRVTDIQKQKERELVNAFGFRDIRLHMVKEIVHDIEEKNKYINEVECGYWHRLMGIASVYSDIELMKSAYRNKKLLEKPTIDDKIEYYKIVSPLKAIILRFFRKFCSICKHCSGQG